MPHSVAFSPPLESAIAQPGAPQECRTYCVKASSEPRDRRNLGLRALSLRFEPHSTHHALGARRLLLLPTGVILVKMKVSRFQIRLSCVCGETTEIESLLAGPGGLAPLGCKCGKSFVLKQLDEAEVVRISVDPTGITGGEIPQDLDLILPKIH